MKRFTFLLICAASLVAFSGCRALHSCCCHQTSCCPSPCSSDSVPADDGPMYETSRLPDWESNGNTCKNGECGLDLPPIPEFDLET